MPIAQIVFQMLAPPLLFLFLGFGIRACAQEWKHTTRQLERRR